MNDAIAQAVEWFGTLFLALIIIRAVLSWFPGSQGNGLAAVIFALATTITEPFVAPIRWLVKRSPIGGGGMGMPIDFAPMLTMILMRVVTLYLAAFIRSL